VRALAILVVIGPGRVGTAHSVLWNTDNAVHSGEPLSEVPWSTDSVLSHSSPGLQLITLYGVGIMKLYTVTNVKKSGLENEHSGRTLTASLHTVIINSCCIKYQLHPSNICHITWQSAYHSIRCYTKPKVETELLIKVQINLWQAYHYTRRHTNSSVEADLLINVKTNSPPSSS